MKLSTKINTYIIIIVIFSLGSMTILSFYQMKDILISQLKDKLMNIATYASEDYKVKEAFKDSNKIPELNEHIEKIRSETNVDFIVVFGMDSIRLTHPVKINIGRKFEGGDETKVLTESVKYISQAKGTLGVSLRAFVPIIDEGKQLGAVCVGSTLVEVNKEILKKSKQFIPFIFIGLFLGIYFAIVLTASIKDEILGLEPKEIAMLLKEKLTGLQKMAWSLRAQNHEFMNKLHTISGLIQLEEYDEAIKYISKTANSGNEIAGTITSNIKNLDIAALLLAKYYKAEELRINFEIDKESNLTNLPDLLSSDDLGSVIGNLIENALEAVDVDGTGKVYFNITQTDRFMIIVVKDNGPGIPEAIIDRIFERSFSTKADHHGYGMFIVKNIINKAKGKINLNVDCGTEWHIEIPMKSGEIND